jgi:prolyl oligopeptidase
VNKKLSSGKLYLLIALYLSKKPSMHKISLVCLLLCQIIIGQNNSNAKKIPAPFNLHNTIITDDYSWMEDIKSTPVKDWVKEQNMLSQAHLEKISGQYDFKKTITSYNKYDTDYFPQKKGRYFFSRYYKEKDRPSSVYIRRKLDEQPEELINTWNIYKNNNVIIENYYPSKSSDIIAFKASTDGSDIKEVRFIKVFQKELYTDVLKNVKFSDVEWNLDLGVFYKRNTNQNRTERDSTFQIMYHKLGTTQEEDFLVYDATKKKVSFDFFTTRDKLIVSEISAATGKTTYYRASLIDAKFELQPMFQKDTDKFELLDYKNDRVYFSSRDYDWGDLRSADINNITGEKVIVPQIYSHLLLHAYLTENYIFCVYKNLSKYSIRVYDYDGNFVRKFDAPEGMTFRIRYYDKDTNNLFVEMHSYTIYTYNYKLNITTGESNPYFNDYIRAKATLFPFNYFETKNITFKSSDNKDIPLTIVYKKGTVMDGNNPTLLEAYGGFGVVSLPNYSTSLLSFIEKGGIYAFAEIRGGGEKGNQWATNGKGLKKTNSFNDFIEAAEYLIKEKYTSPNKLAITGGSNGGLVVGVAMTKRPELFKVAVPRVGVFDMVKFDQFTIGSYHHKEYGNPKIKAEFESLYSYSPFHNIKEDVNYPITLIITSDNDDRVPPLHSYKFAARLQNRVAQKNPIYLLEYSDAGHYGKISTYNSRLEKDANFYSFLWYHLNN